MAIEIKIKGCHCLGIHLQHTFACLSPIVVPKFLLYDLVFLAELNTQEIALGCLVRTSLSIIAACEDVLSSVLVGWRTWSQEKYAMLCRWLKDLLRYPCTNANFNCHVSFACKSNYKNINASFYILTYTFLLELIMLATIASAKVMNPWNFP